ncbi:DUF7487 domain-containing protein [Paenibacillus sp. ALE1]
MLLTKTVLIKTNPKCYQHYKSKGYDFKCNDTIEVNVIDLTPYSVVEIQVKCDYCEALLSKRYDKYHRANKKCLIKKDCCRGCVFKKVGETNLLLYGEEHCMKNEVIKKKVHKTCLDRFGFITPSSSPQIKEKVKTTNRKKYGVDYHNQTKEHIESVKDTCLKKYGVVSYSQTEEYRIKVKNTSLEKYGVRHFTQSEEVQNKKRKTNLDKYGVKNLLQDKNECKKRKVKALITLAKNGTVSTSKQQIYLHKLIGGEINYPIDRLIVDILYDNIVIEYDGTGHDLSVKYGSLTRGEFNQKEIRRDKFLNSKGFKIIRIKSLTQTKLPEDNILKNLILEAKNLFLSDQYKWYEINLDDNCIRYKDKIVKYDFGTLHEIINTGA